MNQWRLSNVDTDDISGSSMEQLLLMCSTGKAAYIVDDAVVLLSSNVGTEYWETVEQKYSLQLSHTKLPLSRLFYSFIYL